MLTAARETLLELGVLSPSEPLPPFSARMTGNLVLLFYLKNGRFYLVKVGIQSALDREYRGLTMAYLAMPENVPQPLRLAKHGTFQVLVARGLHHEPLFPPRNVADRRLLEKGIDTFLAASARAFRKSPPGESSRNLRGAIMQTSKLIGWPDWETYWERIRHRSEELAPVLQHGDFAVNNIGVSDGALVFFDWEDFALIDFPGFDLAVLLLSLNNFSVQELAAKLAGPSAEAYMVRRGGYHLGMSPQDFMDLFPAYLSLFIQTKSMLGYPLKVTSRVATALTEWLGLAQGQKTTL